MTAPQRQGAAAVGTGAADAELAQLVGCPDRNGAEDLVTFFQLETRPTGGGWPSSGAARRTGRGWTRPCSPATAGAGTGLAPSTCGRSSTGWTGGQPLLIARWGTLPLEAG